VLSEEAIEKAFDDEDASFAEDEDAVFTPAVTLWAFLSQVLFKDEHLEPRAIKRRPKEHAVLTKPRDQARADLLKGKLM
jgi:hypothetical protein